MRYLPHTLLFLLCATSVVAQPAATVISLSLPARTWDAAKVRIGGCDTPAACKAAVETWALKRLTDDLAPEITAIRLSKAETDATAVFDADTCAAINEALKVRGKAPLAKCGGN